MCVIIWKPKNSSFDSSLFEHALSSNPHGFGIMYSHEGKVLVEKGLFGIQAIQLLWEKAKNHNVAIHFRWSTSGSIDKENCHPFQVLDHSLHGRDLWMMHNGTFRNIPKHKEYSDTRIFVSEYLTPVLSKDPDLITDITFQKFLSESIGSNKLFFLDGNGANVIINPEIGDYVNGCWVSNVSSIEKPLDFNGTTLSQDQHMDYLVKMGNAIDQDNRDEIIRLLDELGDNGVDIYEIAISLVRQ